MTSLAPIASGSEPPTSERLARAFACTGCGACQSHCELDIPVAETLRDARAEALAGGMAPAEITSFVAEIPRREERVRDHARQLGASTERPTGIALVAGCTMVATDVPRVAALHRAFERWFGEASLVADVCCGAPLLDAGDIEGFRVRAAAMSDRVSAASTILALDAGCAHALTTLAPRRGVETRPIETIESYVARMVRRLPRGALAALGPVAVHDACKLGRSAAVYDAPRVIVEHLTGHPPLELLHNRERSRCSGGGGLLPITARATADAMTDELVESVRRTGAESVVTGCPTSRARLARAGITAFTIGDLLCDLSRGTPG